MSSEAKFPFFKSASSHPRHATSKERRFQSQQRKRKKNFNHELLSRIGKFVIIITETFYKLIELHGKERFSQSHHPLILVVHWRRRGPGTALTESFFLNAFTQQQTLYMTSWTGCFLSFHESTSLVLLPELMSIKSARFSLDYQEIARKSGVKISRFALSKTINLGRPIP